MYKAKSNIISIRGEICGTREINLVKELNFHSL